MEQASWMFPGWCRLVILGEELLEQAVHCSSCGLPVLEQLQPQAEVKTDVAAFKLSFIHWLFYLLGWEMETHLFSQVFPGDFYAVFCRTVLTVPFGPAGCIFNLTA